MKYIINFSGGKDSTAMLLRMIELNYPIKEIVFADTGLEFPDMYNFIKKIEKHIGMKITFLKGKNTWDSWFYGKFTKGKYKGQTRGFPYVVTRCWANRELKAKPLDQYNKNQNDYIAVGIAKDEKHRIERGMYKDSNFVFPLIDWNWSEQDCIAYLQKKGLMNPLYKKFKRLGCWLCPKMNKQSLQILYQEYPKLWAKLKEYEKDSPQGFKPNIKLIDLEKEFENKELIINSDFNQKTLTEVIN